MTRTRPQRVKLSLDTGEPVVPVRVADDPELDNHIFIQDEPAPPAQKSLVPAVPAVPDVPEEHDYDDAQDAQHDAVASPGHYHWHPSGIECIDITRHMPFCLGNAFKYIWRAGRKDDVEQDLRKAIQYLEFEIENLHMGKAS